MKTKLAKDLQINDLIIEGKHRTKVIEIIAVNDKTITYRFVVISEASRGFGNSGKEYRRINTKMKIA